jgi:hypothetical protein
LFWRVWYSVVLLSLLIALAACGLWIRSYFAGDSVIYRRDRNSYGVLWTSGVFNIGWERYPPFDPKSGMGGYRAPPSTAPFWELVRHDTHEPNLDLILLGNYKPQIQFGQFMFCRPEAEFYTSIRVPFWFIVMLNLVPGVVWWRIRHKRNPSLCQVCGYDLRATPDRCPECGTARDCNESSVVDGPRV